MAELCLHNHKLREKCSEIKNLACGKSWQLNEVTVTLGCVNVPKAQVFILVKNNSPSHFFLNIVSTFHQIKIKDLNFGQSIYVVQWGKMYKVRGCATKLSNFGHHFVTCCKNLSTYDVFLKVGGRRSNGAFSSFKLLSCEILMMVYDVINFFLNFG